MRLLRFRVKVIIYLILAVIALTAVVWWHFFNLGQSRDYQRLGDIKVIHSKMTDYFFRFNSYRLLDCQKGSLINFCGRPDSPGLDFRELIDPINQGRFQYLVKDLSREDFKIYFSLESGAAGLPPGDYQLSKQGIVLAGE